MEMQIKTTKETACHPYQDGSNKKMISNKCWQGCAEKGMLMVLVGIQTGVAAMKNIYGDSSIN